MSSRFGIMIHFSKESFSLCYKWLGTKFYPKSMSSVIVVYAAVVHLSYCWKLLEKLSEKTISLACRFNGASTNEVDKNFIATPCFSTWKEKSQKDPL